MSTIQECKERDALFFSFLNPFQKGTRRDWQENPLHYFTVLDRDLSHCNQKIIPLMKKSLEKTFFSNHAVFEEANGSLKARLFAVPDEKEGNPVDIASILQYQKNRVHPSTFQSLDYFSQKDENQRFIAIQLEIQMGDIRVPAAEYLCPCAISSSLERSISQFIQDPPTVQVRRMDKKYIGSSLAHIAELFEQIVKTSPYTQEALKRDLAELLYKWTFTVPFGKKKSDALAESIQTALATLHRFKILNHAKIGDEVLAMPEFPRFLEKYNQDVTLK